VHESHCMDQPVFLLLLMNEISSLNFSEILHSVLKWCI
jgi:hypothetical protein